MVEIHEDLRQPSVMPQLNTTVSTGPPKNRQMSEEQEKKIAEWFNQTWKNQRMLESRLCAIQDDHTVHIHANVLDLYQWVQTLLKDVDNLQRQIARMEQKIGR